MNTSIDVKRSDHRRQDGVSPERVLRYIDWHVIRPLDGILQGDYRSLFYGSGLDLAELREYQVGDDIRRIDWNVTARMNAPYVRQYLEDREVTAWFLMDYSPSMTFGSNERYKQSILVDFVATMARLLTRKGNKVGAMFYNNRIELTIPPGGGRNQVLRLVHEMVIRETFSTGSMTNLTPLLEAALNAIRRRSLIFLISDFISIPGWDRPIKLLNQRHDLVPIRLYDPREIELPDVGVVLMEDSESGEQLYVDTGDQKFRDRFSAAAERRQADMSSTFKRAGMDALSLSTEEDLVPAILRFSLLRKRARRRSAR